MCGCKDLPNNACNGNLEPEIVPDHGLEEPGQDEHSEKYLDLGGKRQMAFVGTKHDVALHGPMPCGLIIREHSHSFCALFCRF